MEKGKLNRMLKTTLTGATNLFKLSLKNIQVTLLIILACVAAGYSYLYNREVANRERLELISEELPPGILSKYIQENRRLVKLVRDTEGKTRVETIYVPDEGRVIVITKERDQAVAAYRELIEKIKKMTNAGEIEDAKRTLEELLEEAKRPPKVIVKNRGFTSRFGYGMIIGPGLGVSINTRSGKLNIPVLPVLDWKWGYWKRFSATVQINPRYIGPGITRHIDDIMPRKLHMNNLEIGISGGIEFTGGKRADAYIRSNF